MDTKAGRTYGLPGLYIRNAAPEEMGFIIGLAASEGWNPGIHDGELFYEADPEGFFIAELEGRPVGCASAVAYDDNFGFLGLYVVRPEFQNKGIGSQLTERCMAYLGDRTIGLDGVVENERKYQDVMKFTSSYSNLRFEGKGGGEAPDGLVEVREVPFSQLLNYDRRMFPAPRDAFLKRWITQPGSHACAVLQGRELKGYGVIRKCVSGYKIGPLFADDISIAERIFLALRSNVHESEPVLLDVPQPNKDALTMAEKYGMSVCFRTIRMYKGKAPDIDLKKVFGVTTFELG